MKLKKISMAFLCLCLCSYLFAQPSTTLRESSKPKTPLDGVVEKTIVRSTPALKYDNVRQPDLFWEKRIWRVLDVREKMNQIFTYPEAPFISLLLKAASEGEITVYSAINDKFEYPLSRAEVADIQYATDTVWITHPLTLKDTFKVVRNDLNWRDIKRFRVKEVWYFDSEVSMMKCRILGIAPLREEYDNLGNFMYEKPMFWVYYPEAREVLAKQAVFNPLNDAQILSWEDILEMRYFSSYIIKASNVTNARLEDIFSGVDLLLESEKIKNEIFNFESDLWSK